MTATVLSDERTQTRLRNLADGLAAATVVSLPWSTSATSILIVLWLIALIPTVRIDDLREVMTRSAAYLPVLLAAIAALGMLWADVAWAERSRGFSGFAKLLVLPLLFVQFRRSPNAHWILGGFLVSCAALLLLSTVSFLWGARPPFLWVKVPGVPVKDYLIQAALFIVSAFILLYLAREAFHARRHLAAALYAAAAAAFVANVTFVVSSRTALLTVPVLVALFAVRHFRWKGILTIATGGVLFAGLIWSSSDYVRSRLGNLSKEIEIYQTENRHTSAGERLEFWKKSVGFVAEAPIFGNGTGSIRSLFARVASSGQGVSSLVSTNPHNQFLSVAVQIGLLGGLVLIAMWAAHAMLFRCDGLAAWVGLVIVTQNVFGSLFNSHLSDFSQGWLYVFGVGVAGGMVMAQQDAPQVAMPVEAAAQV